MATSITMRQLNNNDCKNIIELILPIQQIEFNVPVTLEDQPDLLDIESFYIQDGGNFWGAFDGDTLVGTISLISTGYNAGAIRKMFVKKEYRGKEFGIAQQLLSTLYDYCLNNEIEHLYLGTVDMLKAAHRFYERNNFIRIEKSTLPHYFPRMAADTIYYYLQLKSNI